MHLLRLGILFSDRKPLCVTCFAVSGRLEAVKIIPLGQNGTMAKGFNSTRKESRLRHTAEALTNLDASQEFTAERPAQVFARVGRVYLWPTTPTLTIKDFMKK